MTRIEILDVLVTWLVTIAVAIVFNVVFEALWPGRPYLTMGLSAFGIFLLLRLMRAVGPS